MEYYTEVGGACGEIAVFNPTEQSSNKKWCK
jgi:hypothetical protein